MFELLGKIICSPVLIYKDYKRRLFEIRQLKYKGEELDREYRRLTNYRPPISEQERVMESQLRNNVLAQMQAQQYASSANTFYTYRGQWPGTAAYLPWNRVESVGSIINESTRKRPHKCTCKKRSKRA